MSKTTFRCLVGLKLLFLIALWVTVLSSAHGSAPPDEAATQMPDQSTDSSLLSPIVVLSAAILQVIGLVGLMKLKGWSRHIYLLGVVLTFATSIAGDQSGATSSMIGILSVGYWVIAGAVIAISYTKLTWETLVRVPDV